MYLLFVTEVYRVFVVLDKEYGGRLPDLNNNGPVWIVDTPTNRAAAERIWAVDPNRSHFQGVTTFKINNDHSREEILINELDTIDLHHGVYSGDSAYTVLEIIGARISERLKTALFGFGFDQFHDTTEGFIAVRPLPSRASVS